MFTRNIHENDFVKITLKTVAGHIYGRNTVIKTLKSNFFSTNDCENDLDLKTKKSSGAGHFYGQNTATKTLHFKNLTNVFKTVSLSGLHFNV